MEIWVHDFMCFCVYRTVEEVPVVDYTVPLSEAEVIKEG